MNDVESDRKVVAAERASGEMVDALRVLRYEMLSALESVDNFLARLEDEDA
jgi:hypothetical protein